MATEIQQPVPPKSSPVVLVVEDESSPRAEIARMVRGLGYRVRTTRNGREALRYLAQQPGEVRLVLSDVIMPYMDGGELAERARDLQPGVKLVLMSESSGGAAAEVLAAYPELPCLRKPFGFAELYGVLSWQVGPPVAAGEIRPARPAFHRDREPAN
ncbi:MAG TPA: response regulator [Gemmatimonadales bacterium]|nr:response regulator [Gemmatimonadales bacterium]